MDAGEIAAVAKGAGLTSPDAIAKAVAIAQAESGGNPRDHNSTPPDDSYGLWQINMLGPLGPVRRKSLGLTSNDELYDPHTNARAMMQISRNGATFIPWTTYVNGSYMRFISEARTVTGVEPASFTTSPASFTTNPVGVIDSAKAVAGTLIAVNAWMSDRHNWIRVGYVGLGVGLIAIAAAVVSSGKVATVVTSVKGALPV